MPSANLLHEPHIVAVALRNSASQLRVRMVILALTLATAIAVACNDDVEEGLVGVAAVATADAIYHFFIFFY